MSREHKGRDWLRSKPESQWPDCAGPEKPGWAHVDGHVWLSLLLIRYETRFRYRFIPCTVCLWPGRLVPFHRWTFIGYTANTHVSRNAANAAGGRINTASGSVCSFTEYNTGIWRGMYTIYTHIHAQSTLILIDTRTIYILSSQLQNKLFCRHLNLR
jgi:hypothetical protein